MVLYLIVSSLNRLDSTTLLFDPMTIYELAQAPERLTSGHRLCLGCAVPICVKLVLAAIKEPVVVVTATGCLEVATTIYPYTAWNVPWIHSAFENAAATASGIVEAYNVLRKKGKIKEEIRFVVFGGDGATYDIGLQSLSGALERGHRFLYVCYDNGAYQNTGNQRSSATPLGAATTTTPPGKTSSGKPERRKDITAIVAAHHISYVAQASIHLWQDLAKKVGKAISIDGPSFINIISPCQRSWQYAPAKTVKIARLAVETNFWPLYEVENGKYTINYQPAKPLPIIEWLKSQGRYKHLLRPENAGIVEKIQKEVDERWEELKLKTV